MENKINVYLKIIGPCQREAACAVFSRVDSTLLNLNIVDSLMI